MKKILLVLFLVITLAPAFPQERANLELEVLADLGYDPVGAYLPGAPVLSPPMFVCSLGIGLHLAGGALFIRGVADVSVPAEGVLLYGEEAVTNALTLEVGSNPVQGVEAGVRYRVQGTTQTCAIYLRVQTKLKLF